MKIRNKIIIYFSSTLIALSAISLGIINLLFSEYREEEFQQRQKEKIIQTIKFLGEYKEMSENLSEIMDKLTIHDFYDEKMLVFDGDKDLIYASVDDLNISNYNQILNQLSPSKRWIETKEDNYDIVGIYIENERNSFYAISKAYDNFGYSKLTFLRNTLLIIFLVFVIVVLSISLYLSKLISKPISDLVDHLKSYNVNNLAKEIRIRTTTFEITHLIETFNKLLQKTNETFLFQKHVVQHISHELKTPIAILVSELERIKKNDIPVSVKNQLQEQIQKAKNLGDIINSLLEISKIESGQSFTMEIVRMDEMIFDLIDELNIIHPDFLFEWRYSSEDVEESKLKIKANKLLIRQALENILVNCINYSDNKTAQIKIDCTEPKYLSILFSNSGMSVKQNEVKFMFANFFRGNNSQGKPGFGLGLVLTKRIITLHNGSILYFSPDKNFNLFEIRLPLS